MIYYVHFLSDFLPILVFLFFFKRNNQRQVWVIFLYAISSCISDSIVHYAKIDQITYFYSVSAFTVIEFTLFSAYFHSIYKANRPKNFLVFGFILFIAVATYNVFFDKKHRFDSLPTAVESILIILYSLFYFNEQLRIPETSFIYSTKTFWIVISILLYLAGTFILFVCIAYMTEKEQITYWPIASIANITKNILLSVAFMLRIQTKDKYIQRPSFT